MHKVKVGKWFSAIFLLMVLSVLSSMAHASGCKNLSTGTTHFTIGDINILTTPAVGEVIASFTVKPSVYGEMVQGCNAGYSKYLRGTPTGLKYLGYTDVYASNVPGVGFAICYMSCDGPSSGWPPFVTESTSPPCSCNFGHEWYLVLIATGPISSGKIDSGLYAEVGTEYGMVNNVDVIGGNIKATTCSIGEESVSVAMGNVATKDFSSIGTTSNAHDFNINITCDNKANVSVVMNGVKDENISDHSVISLSNEGVSGNASGVGVQVLYNNLPLPLGESIPLKTVNGDAQETLTFGARYYQTGNVVTAGKANAVATLNIAYQ